MRTAISSGLLAAFMLMGCVTQSPPSSEMAEATDGSVYVTRHMQKLDGPDDRPPAFGARPDGKRLQLPGRSPCARKLMAIALDLHLLDGPLLQPSLLLQFVDLLPFFLRTRTAFDVAVGKRGRGDGEQAGKRGGAGESLTSRANFLPKR